MNGLQIKYTELFSLSVLQSFYENNICPKYKLEPVLDFELAPTAECMQVMRRLDLMYRNIDLKGGIIVLSRIAGTNGGGDDLLRFAPKKEDKLSFWMLLKNPDIFNFDTLPVKSDPASFFYFGNQINDLGATRNNLYLSANTGGFDNVADKIKKSGGNYTYHPNAILSPGDAVVKHVLTGMEIEARAIVNGTGSSDLFFDLSTMPQGRCNLFINHIDTDNFYYVGAQVPNGLFGVIEISLSPLLQANYRVVEADKSLTPERPDYHIQFTNRQTKWRYILDLKENSPLYLEMKNLPLPQQTDFKNQLNIITNDTAIKFTQVSANPAGTNFEFVSDNAIALQEKYISSSSVSNDRLSISLKKYVGNADPAKEAAVKTDLPCPTTGIINATNDPLIYSDILLTI